MIVLPNGLREIPEKCFLKCVNLKEICIPPSVTKIGVESFADCASLSSLILPEGLREIPEKCFSWCLSLKEICIPPSVTKMCDAVFRGCESMTRMVLSVNMGEIGQDCFERCCSLREIYIYDKCKIVGRFEVDSLRDLNSMIIDAAKLCRQKCKNLK